jgi:membrane associated rhomboid family serine protease
MLDDRSYMRPDYEPYGRSRLMMPMTTVLMIALIVAFALQQINGVYIHFSALRYLALSGEGLRNGYVWQLLTFQFLHASLGHIFWNLVGLWCFGRSVEDRLGKAHFLMLYFLSGVAGGLLQGVLGIAFPSHFGGPTYGASAGIAGLVAAFATMEPDARILYSLIIPLRAKHVLYISFAIALFFTLVPSNTDIAHAAHLGGILFGVAYIRRGIGFSQSLAEWNPLRRRSRREKMIKAATVKLPRFGRQANLEETTELPSEEFMSKEVDPILEKISAHGIKSLTEREREILQAARARMSK